MITSFDIFVFFLSGFLITGAVGLLIRWLRS